MAQIARIRNAIIACDDRGERETLVDQLIDTLDRRLNRSLDQLDAAIRQNGNLQTQFDDVFVRLRRLQATLDDSIARTIIVPRPPEKLPVLKLFDVSDCPSQRAIYDRDHRLKDARLFKMVEGQVDQHVARATRELLDDGAVIVRESTFYANGITHRDRLKAGLEEDHRAGQSTGISFVKIAVFACCHARAEAFVELFDRVIIDALQAPAP